MLGILVSKLLKSDNYSLTYSQQYEWVFFSETRCRRVLLNTMQKSDADVVVGHGGGRLIGRMAVVYAACALLDRPVTVRPSECLEV